MVIVWQRIEGLVVFLGALAVFLYANDSIPWWIAVLIFFAPDLSFFGYLISKSAGAHLYNFMHIYGLGTTIAAVGLVTQSDFVTIAGLLLIAHCGFDRALGYGLKHRNGFHNTHLGVIGKAKNG